MDSKRKELILSVVGLAIIAIGAVILCVMKFPEGLLIILPSAIPHIYRLYLYKKGEK